MGLAIWWLAIMKACILPALGLAIFIIFDYAEKRQAKKRARAKRQALIEKSKREYAKMVA